MCGSGCFSATTEWLRTPNAGNANNVRIVNAGNGGALNNNNANNSNGVRPIGKKFSEIRVALAKAEPSFARRNHPVRHGIHGGEQAMDVVILYR